jgi:putative pyruvate formate lyase activating enzyme
MERAPLPTAPTRSRGSLERRAGEALRLLERCALCPRACGAARLAGEPGTCGVGRRVRVSAAFPHLGEERCLSGVRGSGTVFFEGCPLGCVFCQNHDVSRGTSGEELDARALAELFVDLQRRGCHNLNLVTPTHVVPQVLEALALAVEAGFALPLVYNSGGYDALATLRLLDGLVDVYMPDLKVWSPDAAARLLGARDYPGMARAALREMHRQVGDLALDRRGLAVRGLLVRHLVLPGHLEESSAILAWIAEELSPATWVHVMDQYHPAGDVRARGARWPELRRRLSAREGALAIDMAWRAGLQRLDGHERPLPVS